jgi:carboxyl-terminal processing protease
LEQSQQTPPVQPKKSVKHTTRFSASSLWQFAVIGVVFFALGFVFNAWGAKITIGPGSASQQAINLTKFWQVNDIIKSKFDGDIDPTKQSQGAIAGMVASLGDPYTVYLDKKANQQLADQLKGKLSGIGIEVGMKNNHLTVIAPIEGTPAAKAGLKPGDIIAGIDGQDTSNMTVDDAVTKIRGQKDTSVKLTIVRAGAQPQELTIMRDDITVPSVTSKMQPGNIGYIKISEFGQTTATDVQNAVATLKGQGAKAVVIDVRGNPGGYLDGAIQISSQFMSNGTVVEERSRTGENKKFSALAGGQMTDIPVIMLVDGGSASASEIMAGALHDNNRATLVGEKTFGKGSVQEIICLSGLSLSSNCTDDALKVTVAHWYTPNGVNISKEGIKPDVEVKITQDDINAGRDPQLAKALELAKQKSQ